MPHLIVNYTPNLDAETDMAQLCRSLADAALTVRDDAGKQVFPTGGLRVLAYPATHYAVADGSRDFAFCYLNMRIARGRSPAVQQRIGETLTNAARAHFGDLFERRYLGLTVQVDEGAEVFDSKNSTIHPLFSK